MIHLILLPLLSFHLTQPKIHVILKSKAQEVSVVKPTQAELQQVFRRQA